MIMRWYGTHQNRKLDDKRETSRRNENCIRAEVYWIPTSVTSVEIETNEVDSGSPEEKLRRTGIGYIILNGMCA